MASRASVVERRARVEVLLAEGCSNREIARRLGVSRVVVGEDALRVVGRRREAGTPGLGVRRCVCGEPVPLTGREQAETDGPWFCSAGCRLQTIDGVLAVLAPRGW